MVLAICKFDGEHRYLSNFYPCLVRFDEIEYPSVEHAYVAAKTNDRGLRKQIKDVPHAWQVKKLGRRIALRVDWDDIKLSVMYDLIMQKFSSEPLRSTLLSTGDCQIYEGNTWGDRFWGIYRGEGENHLGRIIMRVRDSLQNPLDMR